jgi:peptidyl-prolyl cis-trans isomerase C
MRFLLAFMAVTSIPAAAGADVLASVDAQTLTWDQLVSMVGGLENAQSMGIASTAEAQDLLMSWVREQLIVTAAQAENLESDPLVAAAIDQAVRQILLDAYIQKVTSEIEISRLDVENYIAVWDQSYRNEIHARHILVSDPNLAQALLSRLQAGESFEQIASESSICPSAADGGDLGWLRRGQAVLPFEEAAFALTPGSMSGVVETSMGFHIIKVLETRPITPAPTGADIFSLAGEELVADAQEEALMSIIETLEATHTVTLYPERLLEHVQN